jgi:hypothetical protein
MPASVVKAFNSVSGGLPILWATVLNRSSRLLPAPKTSQNWSSNKTQPMAQTST